MSTRPAASRPPVRLTRRGRLVVFGGGLALLLAVVVGWGPSVVATSDKGEPTPVYVVTVEPGDTLWGIAAAANPDGNTGETVHEIAELNALSSMGDLQVGQHISVPRY